MSFEMLYFKTHRLKKFKKIRNYQISSWKHIYLKLNELGRLESYVIHHLKKQMTITNVLTLLLGVCQTILRRRGHNLHIRLASKM
jgi:hypothetical protein